ncbi:MAG: prepilin-type N-terminal cleavage/methylation domain-containing protein [Patescibacteria group bacterium]
MFGIKWIFNKKSLPIVRRGFTIIEIVVVIAIIVLAFFAILGFFIIDARVTDRSRARLEAISLAEEGVEAIRNFRDFNDWSVDGLGTLSSGVNYHPVRASSSWDIVSGSETINGFIRSIIFNRVSRDTNDNIEQVYNPLNDDPNTRKVTVTITWVDRQGAGTENLVTYLTNWRE